CYFRSSWGQDISGSCLAAKSIDHSGRDREALQFDGIVRVRRGPYPRLAPFDGELAADQDAMPHLEPRPPELADLGGTVRDVVELGGLDEAGAGVDDRKAHDAEGRPQLRRPHAQRLLEHAPDAPVEELEEVAVEDDAGRIAMTPFDDELPVVDEIAHACSVRGGREPAFPRE